MGLKLFAAEWSSLPDSCQHYGPTETLVSKISNEFLSEFELINANFDLLIFFSCYLFIEEKNVMKI
jgi:hypothetical protein